MNIVVVVTGASRGIGAATALLLAKKGYKICINYKNNRKLAESLVNIISQQGGFAKSFQADVSKEVEVNKLIDFTNAELGAVTHLVNNVGILQKQSQLVELSEDRINHILSNNVTSYFLCSKAALATMKSGSAIVNVGSAASRLGAPNEYIDYAASKGAIDSLTKGLSLEVAPQNIRVNCVRPGLIETGIHADGGESDRAIRTGKSLPLGRSGKPEEVAQAIAWLLSDEASFVTGSFIDLAGGA
ncbi:SDR family oxidoreductase [Shewanella sp. 202IG2-18]|uniref:SDR family oxidoreductase n=1 Tax=Parashewanella hymeniacidonis TaxID=2807618 RepID=UPI00195FA77F|nr:SDR family oxidoreductase [Parashewanella hymeniacidonis]MBM7071584.1 SDR family oxidoreductase [Parashewanella hymeniacidonis]